MRDVCGLVGYYREQWLGNPCVLVKIGASVSFWDVEEWLLMPNGIWLNFKFCWMDGVIFGWWKLETKFVSDILELLYCHVDLWAGAIVLLSLFIQPSSYNISWCLQTCHLFSRLSILCWLLPSNKYSVSNVNWIYENIHHMEWIWVSAIS